MSHQWVIAVLLTAFLAAVAARPGVWGAAGGLIYASGVIGRGMANETWADRKVRRRTWLEAATAIVFGVGSAEAFGPWAASALRAPAGAGQAVWFILGLSTPRMYPVAEKLIGSRLKDIIEALLGRSP